MIVKKSESKSKTQLSRMINQNLVNKFNIKTQKNNLFLLAPPKIIPSKTTIQSLNKSKHNTSQPILRKQSSANKISNKNQIILAQFKKPSGVQNEKPIRSKSTTTIITNNNFQQLYNQKKVIKQEKQVQSVREITPVNSQFQMLHKSYKIEQSKISKKEIGKIKGYAANTHRGLVRSYNEDRISIVTNMDKLPNKNIEQIISFFAIYDGHGGNLTADYLKDNFHSQISKCLQYPKDLKMALRKATIQCQQKVIQNSEKNFDFSGSCLLAALTVGNYIYIANVGDSRAIVSQMNGKNIIQITRDHKPCANFQKQRIYKAGGSVYQTNSTLDEMISPFRVFPGKLSVSRTIGDLEAKSTKYGGNNKVVIPQPDIFEYQINEYTDFLFLASSQLKFKTKVMEFLINQATNKQSIRFGKIALQTEKVTFTSNQENAFKQYSSKHLIRWRPIIYLY